MKSYTPRELKSLKGHKVLIIEDMYPIALELQSLLEGAGCAVVGPAADRTEAFHLLHSDRIDAAVLDINIRDGTVFPVADELRERRVPFIFLSGYNKEDFLPERFRDYTCVQKPYSDAELLKTVEHLLEAP